MSPVSAGCPCCSHVRVCTVTCPAPTRGFTCALPVQWCQLVLHREHVPGTHTQYHYLEIVGFLCKKGQRQAQCGFHNTQALLWRRRKWGTCPLISSHCGCIDNPPPLSWRGYGHIKPMLQTGWYLSSLWKSFWLGLQVEPSLPHLLSGCWDLGSISGRRIFRPSPRQTALF